MTGNPLPAGGQPSARRSPKPAFLLLSIAVLALDQWSKWWIERSLPLHANEPVIPGFFHLSHLRNTGVAFGLFAASAAGGGNSMVLLLLGLVALAVVGFYFWRAPHESRLLLTALSLVLGGAVGNLLDRLFQGAVTDFLGFYLGSYRWPDFNIADSAISIGLGLLLVDSLRPRRASGPAPRAPSA
ncbi:MAG: signal peptidase II [Acidobacteria bacterium]|jgi:signal peptidase II|nr:signal peptidase II [Thermoanaerobaculia bacterium]NLN11880.1 signal peptidase II [Acidobacteriota bacterium]OQC36945.1 MAG: Lipoprotein signal peptidase [Acidobacteria bacterium ADurb.Bin051]MBP7813690.1 signal peptidase II [Thermoanaerobaculia bacterium]MBP8845142.1 signal peptidase II [Thermoanaerobaculia bacterium]